MEVPWKSMGSRPWYFHGITMDMTPGVPWNTHGVQTMEISCGQNDMKIPWEFHGIIMVATHGFPWNFHIILPI